MFFFRGCEQHYNIIFRAVLVWELSGEGHLLSEDYGVFGETQKSENKCCQDGTTRAGLEEEQIEAVKKYENLYKTSC